MTRPWQLTQKLRFAQMLLDLAALATAHCLAFMLRFEGALDAEELRTLIGSLPLVILVQYACLTCCRVPQVSWRYVSLLDARRVTIALASATVLLFGLNGSADRVGLVSPALAMSIPPRGVIFIDMILSTIALLGMRVAWRLWLERVRKHGAGSRRRVPTLLVGAGSAGAEALRQMHADPEIAIEPVGFLDDDINKRGQSIHGLRVLGTVDQVKEIARITGARQVVITIGHPSGENLHRIVDHCKKCGVAAKVIPGIRHILEGKVNLAAIRDVAIEDLLRREPVQLDLDSIAGFINGRHILITGAGGSIGSELCRTVCRFGPARLILVEHTENNLFHIHRELANDPSGVELVPCLADICDAQRMEQVFASHRPDMVLHAAAYKHVPMIEWNPGEAIKNNVVGTRMIADLAHKHGVGEFVMISTDKAVNPTSIMGASKRVAEIYIQALSQRSQTRFVAVRFGNVLGSAGSVIPTFKEQIARGGPVTVTHPEMKRYFMTIPEASQLVLQAATMGRGGEIFILDMGEPVKIVDLASNLIALSGFSPKEIAIQFTGIRPGEKLFEELALKDEIAQKTRHPKIFIGRLNPANWMDIDQSVAELQALADCAETSVILGKLKQIVPEFDSGSLPSLHLGHANGKNPGGARMRAKASILLNGVNRTPPAPANDEPQLPA